MTNRAVGRLPLAAITLALTCASVAYADGADTAGDGASPVSAVDWADYGRSVAFNVSKSQGIAGRVELMEDARIKPAMKGWFSGTRWAWGGCDQAKPSTAMAAVCESLSKKPLVPAQLRLVDADGVVHESLDLRYPEAEVQTSHLYGDARVSYLVTVRDSVGAGVDALETNIAEVINSELRWVPYVNVDDGKVDLLGFAHSVKVGWKAVPAKSHRGSDILSVGGGPNGSVLEPKPGYTLTLSRYTFESGQWRRYTRDTEGYWDYEHAFPPRNIFP